MWCGWWNFTSKFISLCHVALDENTILFSKNLIEIFLALLSNRTVKIYYCNLQTRTRTFWNVTWVLIILPEKKYYSWEKTCFNTSVKTRAGLTLTLFLSSASVTAFPIPWAPPVTSATFSHKAIFNASSAKRKTLWSLPILWHCSAVRRGRVAAKFPTV